MNLEPVLKLKKLASEGGILDQPIVQNILHAIALDDDMEMALDAQEFFSLKALPKLISPDPFEPLPEGDEVAGDIEFGKVGNKGNSFGLLFKEMTQHSFLAGRSGSGKTTLLYYIINQLLKKKIPFICFDLKREFRGFTRKSDDVLVLRPEDFKFNPLRPPEGISPLRWVAIFADVFSHSTRLLEGSNSFLLDKVFNLYKFFKVFYGSDKYPSFHELVEILKHVYIPLSSREARYLESVRNRLTSCVITAGDMLKCDKDMVDDLLRQNKSVIFEFYGISEHVTAFLIEMLLTKVYFYRMAQGREWSQSNPLVVFMDEARNIYDYRKEMKPESGIPIIDTITERIRDFGVSLVISSQIPSEICASAKANSYTKLMMSLGSGKDISDLARCMGLNEDQASCTYALEVGEAIVKLADRWTSPFWIKVPEVKMDKDVSDYELDAKMKPMLKEFKDTDVESPAPYENFIDCLKDRGRKQKKVEVISDIVRNLLVNVFNNPYIPVTRRYENLGLSRMKGKLAKDFVMENEYATEVNIKVSNSISNFLVLTQKGLSFCERQGLKGEVWEEIVMGKVSFLHRYYQFLIKNYLTQDGWEVDFESLVNGSERTNVSKKVDLMAVYKINGRVKRKIAVEVAVTNYEVYAIMNCVDNGFDEVRIVCRDETAREKIENDIYRAIDEEDRDFVIVQTINGFLNSMPQTP